MGSKRILLADDEAIIRDAFSRELKSENYSVTLAANGREAIACLQHADYDVVITDLIMPDIDGIGVLREAKKLAPETAVIILTGFSDISSVIDALRLGADDYLLKPCETDELLFRLSRCLHRQDLVERLKNAHAEMEEKIQDRTADLKETNIALHVLLRKREKDKALLEQQVMANITDLIAPCLQRLERTRMTEQQRALVGILKLNLNELTSSFVHTISSTFAKLTPAEIQVANCVKQGQRTKEIADLLSLSPGTISIHRKNIRKKLGISHQKVNLQSLLASL